SSRPRSRPGRLWHAVIRLDPKGRRYQTCPCPTRRNRAKTPRFRPRISPGSPADAKTEPFAENPGRSSMPAVKLIVNGKPVTADVDPRTLLVQFLRENLRLTGTHVGCDTSQCGACVVHVNGKAVKSCTLLVLTADGADVRTIESLANGEKLHPMQEAFR